MPFLDEPIIIENTREAQDALGVWCPTKIVLTKEQVKALLEGKVIAAPIFGEYKGEYVVFIRTNEDLYTMGLRYD